MRNIAHRGASGYAPENTAAAFEVAIGMGADAIETDVQITRDGHLVLFHDDSVDRTSDGRGPLADFTLSALQALDIGGWYGEAFAGQRVLTLEAAYRTWASRIPLVLEIKDPLAAEPLTQWLQASAADDVHEITSFSWSALFGARRTLPNSRFGFLTSTWNADLIDRITAAGFAQVCPHVRDLDVGLVNIAHHRGLEVRAWGVRERLDLTRARTCKADGVTCNWPDWAHQR